MKILVMIAAAFALTIGCTSKTIKDPSAARTMIFPYGTYKHDIELTFAPPGLTEKTMSFAGVAKVSEDKISLVSLSPLNTTVFRINEDRKTGEVTSEVYVDSLKPMQARVKEVYGLVKTMLTTPYEGGKPGVLNIKTEMGPAQIRFQDYDANEIPGLVTVMNPKFKMRIKVTGYEI